MPLLDAHTHILPPELIAIREQLLARDAHFGALYANPRSRLASADELHASLASSHLDGAVAFGFAFRDVALCQCSNDYTLASAAESRGRLIPLVVTNPAAPAGLREASRCLAAGARGVGELMPAGQGYDLDAPGLDALLDLASEAGVPVLLHVNEPLGHAYPGKGPYGPAEALRLIQRHPQNDIILAHWGGGLCFYELMPEVRAACERVYYDAAASLYLYADTIYAHALSWAPERVLWGSDYPLVTQRRALNQVQALGLPPEVEAALLGGNAARLFQWSCPDGEQP
ncbi:MAG: amidohydrolase family protein [Anaerolineales bacterium]